MTYFNFSEAIKQASNDLNSTALEAIILAPSGGGKSSLMGTFGVKTLFLYGSGEAHGSKAATVRGSDRVVPVCYDYADGASLPADMAYSRLLTILNDVEGIKAAGFKAIAVDGASEIEVMIRNSTQWKKACLSINGKHNAFAEGPATIEMFRPIINALKHLQRQLGTHFAMSLILDVKSVGVNGEIEESAPRLKGFSVAEQLLCQFGDVLVVGKLQRDTTIKYKIQFMTEITKVSKDEVGNLKKSINFSPRLSGITVPNTMDADLSEVIKLKEEK